MNNNFFRSALKTIAKIFTNKWTWLLIIIIAGGLFWHFKYGTARNSENGQRKMGQQGGAWGGWGGGRSGQTVGVAAVTRDDIPVIINALGTVTSLNTVNIRPQISGVLQQVNFREGETVKAGQILAVIDPRSYQLAYQQTLGQRQRDEAQLDNARVILKRDQELFQQDSISKQDLEAQITLVKQLEGLVIADRAQEGTAQLNLSYTKIIAPISGRVGLRMVDPGNIVSAADTSTIATITQTSPIDVQFSIPQAQVFEVQSQLQNASPLNPIKVSVMDANRTHVISEGDFLALDNQVDITTGTVKAKARFKNQSNELFPNEFVNVKIVARTIQNALIIPVAALRHSNNGDYVFVANTEDSTAAQHSVVAGQADGERVEIIKGLTLGDKVITEGADRLKDGAKINLPGDHPSADGNNKPAGDAAAGDKKDWKNSQWRRDHSANGDNSGSTQNAVSNEQHSANSEKQPSTNQQFKKADQEKNTEAPQNHEQPKSNEQNVHSNNGEQKHNWSGGDQNSNLSPDERKKYWQKRRAEAEANNGGEQSSAATQNLNEQTNDQSTSSKAWSGQWHHRKHDEQNGESSSAAQKSNE